MDGNHGAVIEALEMVGAKVQDTSRVGEGFTDLVVGYRGRVYLIEVKDGDLPPSDRRLTPSQRKWHEKWAGYCWLANSPHEALMIIGAVDG